MSTRSSLLRTQLLHYKLYHHQRTNVRIHMVFVPTILFSTVCILHRVSLSHGITLAHLFSTAYALYYIYLCFFPGILASLLFTLLLRGLDSGRIQLSLPTQVGLFALGWIFQFIGHGYFERRKPALLDNLVQSVVEAPYFVLFELLFKVGLFADLREDLEKGVAASQQT